MRRRVLLAAGTAAAAWPASAQPVPVPPWPVRPVRILVPFGLGGSADVAARFLAEPLSAALGVPVVVENRPGGGAVIGTDVVAKAAPDGHTLLMMSNTHTANETLIPNRPYALLRDLSPVAAVNIAFHVLAVHPALPAATLPGLIAHARANPGRVDFASSGPGTPYHIAGEVFCAMAGIRMNHVPFRGSNEARTALIAGQVPVMFDAIPTMREQIAGRRVRGLATTGPERSPLLPDLPSVAEAGFPGFDAAVWYMVMGPPGLPDPITQRWVQAVNKILAEPGLRGRVRDAGFIPGGGSSADAAALLRRDADKYAELIRRANIRIE